MAERCWTLEDLWHEVASWEEELHAQGYSQSTVWTYLRGSHLFLRWLAGGASEAATSETGPGAAPE